MLAVSLPASPSAGECCSWNVGGLASRVLASVAGRRLYVDRNRRGSAAKNSASEPAADDRRGTPWFNTRLPLHSEATKPSNLHAALHEKFHACTITAQTDPRQLIPTCCCCRCVFKLTHKYAESRYTVKSCSPSVHPCRSESAHVCSEHATKHASKAGCQLQGAKGPASLLCRVEVSYQALTAGHKEGETKAVETSKCHRLQQQSKGRISI